MAHVHVHNQCSDFSSYRAARVKSLFNVDSGCDFTLHADLAIEDPDWRIGLIVGPSGSGKTSICRSLFADTPVWNPTWPTDAPIIDAIAPGASFDDVPAALAAVGLGNVPAWLRPFHALSNGEQFRANLARVVCERPALAVIDEFTSVVDRQIARIGAMAFQKAWRRGTGRAVMASCHYDIVEWLEPDWVFDTGTGTFTRGGLWQRPKFDVTIHKTDWRYWPHFAPHHYLALPKMVAAVCYVAAVDNQPVAHVAVGTFYSGRGVEARACRLVVLPEWQGAGVGMRFLNAVCAEQAAGGPLARLVGRPVTTLFHTSHPGLVAGLRRDPAWRQVSATLFGVNKRQSKSSMNRVQLANAVTNAGSGYGGHFRAVQGFRYVQEHQHTPA
jgi:energy-coupling factor transporter ATP-binding protein EcfA2